MNVKQSVIVICSSFCLIVVVALLSRSNGQPPKPTPLATPHAYKVKVNEVVDGDTVKADLNVFDNLWYVDDRIRIAGVDCPELPTLGGQAARQFTVRWLMDHRDCVFQPYKSGRDKYGRLLGDLHASDGTKLSEALLRDGYAKKYVE